MYLRNRLARHLHRQFRFVSRHQPLGSIAIYDLFNIITTGPLKSTVRNPGKRWLKTRIGGRTLYWANTPERQPQ